ncbi:hypothetical protein MKEN_01437600 [Mycena kentingensis (nom. inval.)]|nr:hypothetical protein MKEN_01437600 [Mycena kentingensis (nom. inval.)]
MFPTRRVLAHHPLIKFLGKRTWPSGPTPAKGHPAAPPEFQKAFSAVTSGSPASASKSGGGGALSEFWEAPRRFWHRELEESEIDAITSGGASLH